MNRRSRRRRSRHVKSRRGRSRRRRSRRRRSRRRRSRRRTRNMSGGAVPVAAAVLECEGDHRVPLAMPVAAAVPPYEYDHLVPLAVLASPREGLQLAHRRPVARPPHRSLRRALEDGTLWQWIRERAARRVRLHHRQRRDRGADRGRRGAVSARLHAQSRISS